MADALGNMGGQTCLHSTQGALPNHFFRRTISPCQGSGEAEGCMHDR